MRHDLEPICFRDRETGVIKGGRRFRLAPPGDRLLPARALVLRGSAPASVLSGI